MQDQMHSQIINTKDIINLSKYISELYKQTGIFLRTQEQCIEKHKV